MNLTNIRSRFSMYQVTAGSILILLCLVLVTLVMFGSLSSLPRLVPVPYQQDFTAYYLAAQVLNADEQLYQADPMSIAAQKSDVTFYTPYLYPPVVAVLLRPLAAMPFDVAMSIWYIFNLICLLVSIGIMIRTLGYSLSMMIPASFLIFLLSPVFLTLFNGQITILLLFLLVGSFSLSVAPESAFKKDVIAGILVGVATALKLYPGLIGVFYLVHRRFVSLIAMIATIFMMFMVGIIAGGGLTNTTYWVTYILPHTSQLIPAPFLYPDNQSLFAVIGRFFSTNQFSFSIANKVDEQVTTMLITPVFDAPAMGNILSYLLAGVILLLTIILPTARLIRNKDNRLQLADFALLLTTILLITPVVWNHYYILYLPALFVLVQHSQRSILFGLVLAIACILIELERYWRWIWIGQPLHSPIILSFGFIGTLILWAALLWLTSTPGNQTSLLLLKHSDKLSTRTATSVYDRSPGL